MSFDVLALRLGVAVVTMAIAAAAYAIINAVSSAQRKVVDVDVDNGTPRTTEDCKKCA